MLRFGFFISSLAFGTKSPTSSELKEETKKITDLIECLREKERELKDSPNFKTGSLNRAKYNIISPLLSRIKKSIDDFNKIPLSYEAQNLKNGISLLREIANHLKEVKQNPSHQVDLLQFRDQQREHGQAAVKVAGTLVAGGMFLSGGVSYGVAALSASSLAGSVVSKKTDLYSTLPESCVLLNDLSELVNLTIKKWIKQLNAKELETTVDNTFLTDRYNMVCPITKKLIEEPALFVFDGYFYEKLALIHWLTNVKTSYVTRKPIAHDAVISDLVQENNHLKGITETFKKEYLNKNRQEGGRYYAEPPRTLEMKYF